MGNEPTEYDAQGTYKRLMQSQTGPRNIPASHRNRIQAMLVNAIENDPELKSEHVVNHWVEIETYKGRSDEERMDFVKTCEDESMLLAIKVVEDNENILDQCIKNIRAIRTKPEPPLASHRKRKPQPESEG